MNNVNTDTAYTHYADYQPTQRFEVHVEPEVEPILTYNRPESYDDTPASQKIRYAPSPYHAHRETFDEKTNKNLLGLFALFAPCFAFFMSLVFLKDAPFASAIVISCTVAFFSLMLSFLMWKLIEIFEAMKTMQKQISRMQRDFSSK